MVKDNKLLDVLDSLNSMCSKLKNIENNYKILINRLENHPSYLKFEKENNNN